ncbi:hypothetical protein HNQ94_001035 [Salirhabdus euzebyi]|uniref:Peptidase S9 prolyl oligopeptidase catalytic domain-containing protein n=1 Tax=Salirhabdus euzebyi TaxID=394506 RepID=A0A841PUV9_9BACI|nr:prolyl oligopeptidase family serine peptidase [Salirhabdus euzebyi]MBB6452590.1 hypothetical protein [Salirhabdus euzebyi]
MYTKDNIREIELHHIRCLLSEPVKANGFTLFIYHGWGSAPENQVFLAKILSSYGFIVVLPEMIHHSTRNPLANPFDQNVMQTYFWETVIHTVEESNQLFQSAIKAGIAQKENIGLIGSSTGGIISSGIFAQNPAIRFFVSINGSPAWVESERLWREKDGRGPITEEERQVLAKFDLHNHVDIIQDRPILLLHGSNDSVLSPIAPKYFYEKMRKKVRDSDITYSEYRNVDHTISLNMIEEMVNWLIDKATT